MTRYFTVCGHVYMIKQRACDYLVAISWLIQLKHFPVLCCYKCPFAHIINSRNWFAKNSGSYYKYMYSIHVHVCIMNHRASATKFRFSSREIFFFFFFFFNFSIFWWFLSRVWPVNSMVPGGCVFDLKLVIPKHVECKIAFGVYHKSDKTSLMTSQNWFR